MCKMKEMRRIFDNFRGQKCFDFSLKRFMFTRACCSWSRRRDRNRKKTVDLSRNKWLRLHNTLKVNVYLFKKKNNLIKYLQKVRYVTRSCGHWVMSCIKPFFADQDPTFQFYIDRVPTELILNAPLLSCRNVNGVLLAPFFFRTV
jgi:hypothetical protein